VDEAAMMDTRTYKRLMDRAAESGAKVILAGDDRQLGSVERGGMFTVLKEAHGSVKISKVRRQVTDWQREASEDFSEGRMAEGLRAYAEHGHVHWSKDIEESRSRLLSDWDMDSREQPDKNRFVYAGTNIQVNRLNKDIRDIRVRRGEVTNELETETVRGKLMIGTGDRIQFHGNDRKAGIYNGSLATIEKIERGWVKARTDTGRSVAFNTATFKEFGLGYAGTVYRGQGKTQPEVYALYDNVFAWNARTAYVGLTRHQNRVELYVSRDLAPNEIALGERMAHRFREEASLAYATRDEIRERSKGRDEDGRTKATGDGIEPKRQTPKPFPREQVDALRRLNMTEYARDVHGYSIEANLFGAPNRYRLERPDGKGGIEELEVRQASDGHWTFRDPSDRHKRGDIFDLARREGAPNLEVARHDVAAYWDARAKGQDLTVFKGTRSRYDILRTEHEKAMKDGGKDKADDQELPFIRDRNPDRDRDR
jgi:hypothetical protein